MTGGPPTEEGEAQPTAATKPSIAEVAAWLRRAAESREPIEDLRPPDPQPAPAPAGEQAEDAASGDGGGDVEATAQVGDADSEEVPAGGDARTGDGTAPQAVDEATGDRRPDDDDPQPATGDQARPDEVDAGAAAPGEPPPAGAGAGAGHVTSEAPPDPVETDHAVAGTGPEEASSWSAPLGEVTAPPDLGESALVVPPPDETPPEVPVDEADGTTAVDEGWPNLAPDLSTPIEAFNGPRPEEVRATGAPVGPDDDQAALDDSAPMPAATRVDEPPVDEPPVEEPPAEQAPTDQAPTDQAPLDEAPVDEAPVEEPPLEVVAAEDVTGGGPADERRAATYGSAAAAPDGALPGPSEGAPPEGPAGDAGAGDVGVTVAGTSADEPGPPRPEATPFEWSPDAGVDAPLFDVVPSGHDRRPREGSGVLVDQAPRAEAADEAVPKVEALVEVDLTPAAGGGYPPAPETGEAPPDVTGSAAVDAPPRGRSLASLFDLDLADLAARARSRAGIQERAAPAVDEPEVDALDAAGTAEPRHRESDVEPAAKGGIDLSFDGDHGDEQPGADVTLDPAEHEEAGEADRPPKAAAALATAVARQRAKRSPYPRGQLKERIGFLRRVRAMLGVVVLTVVLGVAAGAAIGAFLLFLAFAVRSAIDSG